MKRIWKIKGSEFLSLTLATSDLEKSFEDIMELPGFLGSQENEDRTCIYFSKKYERALMCKLAELGIDTSQLASFAYIDPDFHSLGLQTECETSHFHILSTVDSDLVISERSEKHIIRLAPGVGFGTGHHQTTAMCLDALIDCRLDSAYGLILDIGSGSGILTLAASMLYPEKACIGCDIDYFACKQMKQSAHVNGRQNVYALCASWEAIQGRAELLFANIYTSLLQELSAEISMLLSSNGAELILSGFNENDQQSILDTYLSLGCQLVGQQNRDGWCMLHMQYKKP